MTSLQLSSPYTQVIIVTLDYWLSEYWHKYKLQTLSKLPLRKPDCAGDTRGAFYLLIPWHIGSTKPAFLAGCYSCVFTLFSVALCCCWCFIYSLLYSCTLPAWVIYALSAGVLISTVIIFADLRGGPCVLSVLFVTDRFCVILYTIFKVCSVFVVGVLLFLYE